MDGDEHIKNNIRYIFGRKMRDQARLLRLARKEAYKWRKIELERYHYDYIVKFFKKHFLLTIGLLLLLFSQGITETTLIIFSRNYLSSDSRFWLANHFWALFIVLIVIFLLNSFFSIKYERSLVIMLTNSIRRRLFKSYISRGHEHSASLTQADLIAKISYHLPLVSSGISNVFFGICRWLVYFGIIFGIAVMGHYRVLTVTLCFIGLSACVSVGAYFISRYYASQEVTFYSRIIREVDMNASNIDFLKTFRQENSVLYTFDKLVWFDSFFRVRRDIYMRIGFKFVFVLLVIISIFSNFLPTRFFSFIGTISIVDRVLIVFILMYFSRALNEAMKIGLYLFPARLGLFLTIFSSSKSPPADTGFSARGVPLTFYGYKTKLFKEGSYHRNLRFTFQPGERVLFFGNNFSGKTSLARLFAGISAYSPRALKVTVGNKRLEFFEWQNLCRDVYFFNPNFQTDRSLMECILGKVKEDIAMEKFAMALGIMNQYSAITQLVTSDGNYNVSADVVLRNPLQAFALHALHALVTEPAVVVIDNFWLDVQYQQIFDMIQVLDQALPRSIILIFSHATNTCIPYSQRYEIDTKIRPVS